MDKNTKEKIVKLIDMFESWRFAMKEVEHYLEQDLDYFTVSSGPWKIEYDNTKESEVVK